MDREGDPYYTLTLTNHEVMLLYRKMVKGWFRIREQDSAYNGFVKALLLDDVDSMNEFMNKIALQSFASFDVAKSASGDDDIYKPKKALRRLWQMRFPGLRKKSTGCSFRRRDLSRNRFGSMGLLLRGKCA